jgi:hypothetical protein
MSTITEFEQMIAESAEDRKGRVGFSEPAAERIGGIENLGKIGAYLDAAMARPEDRAPPWFRFQRQFQNTFNGQSGDPRNT